MNEKEKIKYYLENKGISKNKFYTQTGLSVGFLDSGNSLGVDKARIIINTYPDINLEWLVLGKGKMICPRTPHLEKPNNIVSKATYDGIHGEDELLCVGLRIDEVMKIKGIDSDTKFAEIIDTDYEALMQVKDGNTPAADVLLLKIYKTFPDINPVWLSTGIGTPHIQQLLPINIEHRLAEQIAEKEKQLAEKDGTIELQKTTISALNEAKDLLKKQIETMEKEMAELNHQLLLMQKNSVPTKTTDAPNTFQTLG